ncbi:hypothetical protein [Bacillus piscicola]|nr:hypothetical protein [Bacillus piscicola]
MKQSVIKEELRRQFENDLNRPLKAEEKAFVEWMADRQCEETLVIERKDI